MASARPEARGGRALAGALVAACVAGIASCGGEGTGLELDPPAPWPRTAFPPLVEPEENPASPEKIELGRLLFYDPVLGRDELVACATCHSEIWGMSDGLAVSVGVDGEGPTGPGRTGPNLTTRNAQTLWNVAYRRELFWDGRSPSLEAQALEPLLAERELDLDPEEAAARLRTYPGYVELFRAAFPELEDPISPTTIAYALAAFQRSIVSTRAPYDRYLEGDVGSLSEASREGMFLFADAGCAGCHAPPLFEADRYAARIPTDDPGRMEVTGSEADRGAFRVPTLRNLRETGPYFHDGSAVTLADAVQSEATRAAELGEGRALTEDEVALVVTFLTKGLVDRSREPLRPYEVPSGLPVPVDGFRVPR